MKLKCRNFTDYVDNNLRNITTEQFKVGKKTEIQQKKCKTQNYNRVC